MLYKSWFCSGNWLTGNYSLCSCDIELFWRFICLGNISIPRWEITFLKFTRYSRKHLYHALKTNRDTIECVQTISLSVLFSWTNNTSLSRWSSCWGCHSLSMITSRIQVYVVVLLILRYGRKVVFLNWKTW